MICSSLVNGVSLGYNSIKGLLLAIVKSFTPLICLASSSAFAIWIGSPVFIAFLRLWNIAAFSISRFSFVFAIEFSVTLFVVTNITVILLNDIKINKAIIILLLIFFVINSNIYQAFLFKWFYYIIKTIY